MGAQSPVGTPTTVVYADALSQPAILQGIRSGRVFVDIEGAHLGRILDVSAEAGGAKAVMGSTLKSSAGQLVTAHVHVAGAQGDHVDLIVDGQVLKLRDDPIVHTQDQTLDFTLPSGVDVHWFRADVRAPDGRRVLIGNPIYVVAR